jgi:hypothetical protein
MNTKSLLTRIAVPVLSLGLLGGAGATLATSASAATLASSSDVSAYFYGPSSQTLSGPQRMGPFGSAHVSFSQSQYLALTTEKMNNTDLTGKTIHITGTLDSSGVTDRHLDPTGAQARVYFEGSGGGTNANSSDGYQAQQWWAHGDAAVLDLNTETGVFDLTIQVLPTSDWSNWNGQSADANPDLFGGAASHVRQIGLSFGSGHFFETGVEGTGGLTITNITVN